METALFLNGLTDRTPNKYHMTFPSNYNISNIDSTRVIANRVKDELYDIGTLRTISPGRNQIYCYNSERTLCDILRPRSKTDIQIISESFKNYVKSEDRNIIQLTEFSKKFGVEKKLRSYLEVLL